MQPIRPRDEAVGLPHGGVATLASVPRDGSSGRQAKQRQSSYSSAAGSPVGREGRGEGKFTLRFRPFPIRLPQKRGRPETSIANGHGGVQDQAANIANLQFSLHSDPSPMPKSSGPCTSDCQLSITFPNFFPRPTHGLAVAFLSGWPRGEQPQPPARRAAGVFFVFFF